MSALRYFLAAYFHQDWILEANHTRAVAERFAREEPRELVEETLKLNTGSEILDRCLQLADSRYGDLLG